MATKIQFRRGTSAQWILANPILAEGEPGYETDTKLEKIGDGVTAWSNLAYKGGSAAFTVDAPLELNSGTNKLSINKSVTDGENF